MHHIITEIKNDSLASRLFLEIGDDYIACCAITEGNSIAAFQLYSHDSGESFHDTLRGLKENLPLADTDISVNVVWQNAYATCIPKDLVVECTEPAAIQRILNAPPSSVLFTASVQNATLFYFVEEDKIDAFKKIFPKINITHKYATTIHRAENYLPAAKNASVVYAVFFNGKMTLTIFAGKVLQLVNTYAFAAEADVVYHLLNAAKQLHFDWKDTLLVVSGSIDGDSALYRQIYNFIPHIEADVLEEYALDTKQLKEYPLHYFSPYFSNIIYFKK